MDLARCSCLVASATAAATAAVAASATTTTAATTSSAALFAGPGFVDSQAAAINFLQVERLNGSLGLAVVVHFDKAKTLAASGITVLNDRRIFHLAKLREELLQALARDAVSQITNIQSHSHCTFLKTQAGPLVAFRADQKGISVVIRQ